MCVVVTCEVAHRLQFEGLQDGFKRSHLDVHLLVDLHVVVIQVWLLMMSSNDVIQTKVETTTTSQETELTDALWLQNLFSPSTLWWNSEVASISFFSCSVNWQEKHKMSFSPTLQLCLQTSLHSIHTHTNARTMSEILLLSRLMSSLVSARTFWVSSWKGTWWKCTASWKQCSNFDCKITRSSTAQTFCLTWSLFFSCSSSRFIFYKEEHKVVTATEK